MCSLCFSRWIWLSQGTGDIKVVQESSLGGLKTCCMGSPLNVEALLHIITRPLFRTLMTF